MSDAAIGKSKHYTRISLAMKSLAICLIKRYQPSIEITPKHVSSYRIVFENIRAKLIAGKGRLTLHTRDTDKTMPLQTKSTSNRSPAF
jgi:hypothetical protein